MKKVGKRLLAGLGFLPRLLPDLLAVGGAACIAYGVHLIYPPGGWITGGLLLLAGAVICSKGGDRG